MDKSFLKNPIAIAIAATVLALIPLLLNSESILVLLRLVSFVLFFYATHLFLKKKKVVKN